MNSFRVGDKVTIIQGVDHRWDGYYGTLAITKVEYNDTYNVDGLEDEAFGWVKGKGIKVIERCK